MGLPSLHTSGRCARNKVENKQEMRSKSPRPRCHLVPWTRPAHLSTCRAIHSEFSARTIRSIRETYDLQPRGLICEERCPQAMKCLQTSCIQTRNAYHTVTCVPKLRWTPKHRLHRKMPNVVDAYRGFLSPQSAQTLFAVSWQFHTQPTSIMSALRQVGSDACASDRFTLTCKSLFRASEAIHGNRQRHTKKNTGFHFYFLLFQLHLSCACT